MVLDQPRGLQPERGSDIEGRHDATTQTYQPADLRTASRKAGEWLRDQYLFYLMQGDGVPLATTDDYEPLRGPPLRKALIVKIGERVRRHSWMLVFGWEPWGDAARYGGPMDPSTITRAARPGSGLLEIRGEQILELQPLTTARVVEP